MKKIIIIIFIIIVVLVTLLYFKPYNSQAVNQNNYFTRNLYYGMKRNNDVINLQKFLKEQGYFFGPASGNFGPSTLNAVKKFQLSYKIKPSGYWGPQTRIVAKNIKITTIQQNMPNVSGTPAPIIPTAPSTVIISPTTTIPTVPPVAVVLPATITPLSITTTAIPSATAGVAYSVTLSATGGTGSYSWQVAGGSFPTGLNLVPTLCNGPSCPINATIFGTPISASTYNFTIGVTSGMQVSSQQFTLVVSPSSAALKISQLAPSTFNVAQTFQTQALYTPAPNCYPGNPCALPDATAVMVQWTSSNTAVATVTYKYYDPTTVIITAISPGSEVITANYTFGNVNLTATLQIFVSGTINGSLQISPSGSSVSVSKIIALQAVYNPQYNCSPTSCVSPGSSIAQAVWTSSNTSVATVAYKSDDPKTAIVTAIATGVTTITANVSYTAVYGTTLIASTTITVTP